MQDPRTSEEIIAEIEKLKEELNQRKIDAIPKDIQEMQDRAYEEEHLRPEYFYYMRRNECFAFIAKWDYYAKKFDPKHTCNTWGIDSCFPHGLYGDGEDGMFEFDEEDDEVIKLLNKAGFEEKDFKELL